jgi:hypothetical protein
VRPRGNVHLLVRGDDQTLADLNLAGNKPGQPIDVDLTGVRRLTVIADFTDKLDVSGHAVLGDARIMK